MFNPIILGTDIIQGFLKIQWGLALHGFSGSWWVWFTLWNWRLTAVLLQPSCWVSQSDMWIQFDESTASLTMEILWAAEINPCSHRKPVYFLAMASTSKNQPTFLPYRSCTGEMIPPSTSCSFFCRKSLASSAINNKHVDFFFREANRIVSSYQIFSCACS